jgi:hypothetical protein
MDNKNLEEFRHCLLALHKGLIEYQKNIYQGQFGVIASTGQFLHLLTSDHNFSWLRQISEFIVAIDELLDSKKNIEAQKINDLIKYAQQLIEPNQNGNDFAKKYFVAISQSPLVALEHAKVVTALKNLN